MQDERDTRWHVHPYNLTNASHHHPQCFVRWGFTRNGKE